jgi:hypothetical protein
VFVLAGCGVIYHPNGAYGAYEGTFLSGCESHNGVAFCNCALGYLEQTESLQQIVYDGNNINAGGAQPAYLRTAEQLCQWAG